LISFRGIVIIAPTFARLYGTEVDIDFDSCWVAAVYMIYRIGIEVFEDEVITRGT
jgi:hypothetical protein